jgi:hypothetical protein
VGMCWSQLARVDHMCKKMWTRGRRKIFASEELWAPV